MRNKIVWIALITAGFIISIKVNCYLGAVFTFIAGLNYKMLLKEK